MKQTPLQEQEYYLIPTELIDKIQSDLGSLASYITNHFDDLALIARQLGDNEIINLQIEFDAKKVAEEMYYYFQALMESPLTRGMKSSEAKEGVKYSLQYSHYTPSQRQQILTELNK